MNKKTDLYNVARLKIKSLLEIKSLRILWMIPVFLIIAASNLYAKNDPITTVAWHHLIIGVCGGLAFFLYGMEKMSDGMKKSAGDQMRSILATLTKNRFIALFVGIFVTMVIQSSSATTVMLVSFVQAGLMTFAQSLGVILGADIGTTITAQMIAFKLTDYALLMVAAGFLLQMFSKGEKYKNIGGIILGFGILFFGMKLMSDAMKPLRTFQPFISMMSDLENPFIGILVGTAFTALIQSSSASTGIVIVLAQQGLITLDAGIPVIFGSNIGTCVTAGLASIGAEREAKRVAVAHVLFKVAGVCLFIFWIPQFADMIKELAHKFNSGEARQIANAHTIFNVTVGLVFLPFIGLFEKLIYKILPDKEEETVKSIYTLHLDDNLIETPALAIDLARAEISHMARTLERMLNVIIIPFISDAKMISKEVELDDEAKLYIKEIPTRDEFYPELTLLEGIDMREEKMDYLDEKITSFLTRTAQQGLTENQTSEVFGMTSIVQDLESIGDLVHRNMMPLIAKKKKLAFDFSDEGKEEIMIYHRKVVKQISRLQEAFSEADPNVAMRIMKKERKYIDLEYRYRAKHFERLVLEKEQTVGTHEVHMELMDLMKQVIVYSANIAQTFQSTCRMAAK